MSNCVAALLGLAPTPGMLAMIAGLLLIALPIAIISQKFQETNIIRQYQTEVLQVAEVT